MAKKIVTLYIDDASIRLLVSSGKKIKQWAHLPLEPGLVRNGVITEEEEVTARLKQLLESRKLKGKVCVGVSGLHCLSRPITLPKLPAVMLAEAVRREAKRVLPVPLEQLYLSWQTVQAPGDKVHIFLVAIPRKMADPLLRVMHELGIKPDLMDIKPLLLARAVKERTAIIVDIQPTEFDIVIISDGMPQPVRTVPLPREATTWEQKLPIIRDEIERTIKFYNSNNPDKPLVPDVPIFAAAAMSDEEEVLQSLSSEFERPVISLPMPLQKYPQALDPSHYMVNICLVLKKTSSGKDVPLVVNLNTLPDHYKPKPPSLMRVLAMPSAAVATGLLIFQAIFVQSVSADIASMRGQIATANQLIQQQVSQRQGLTDDISQAETSRDNFAAALSSLQEQSSKMNDDLKVTMDNLPGTITLKSTNYSGGTATLAGIAPNEEVILSYLSALDASGRFSDLNVNSLRQTDGTGLDFTLNLITEKGD